jgi:hypothetical protein
MNAQKEIESDSENFDERITKFRAVVEKLWRFEVPGAFLQISSYAHTYERLRKNI